MNALPDRLSESGQAREDALLRALTPLSPVTTRTDTAGYEAAI